MDTGNYSYEDLAKKYDGFAAPAFEIKMAGKKIDPKNILISNLEVELNATGAAGGCTFTMESRYDFDKKGWITEMGDTLEVGAKLQIDGGYVNKQELFYGYVDDYSLQFPDGDSPRIVVNGMDGLGYLMCFREPIYAGKNKPKQVIEEILGKAQKAGYATGVTVGGMDGYETPVLKKNVDDWKFLNILAKRYGMTLTCIDGELVFKDLASSTSPILTLSMGKSLFSFERKLSMAHQVGKVEIWGHDVNNKPLKGEASKCSIGGEGKTAIELAPKFKEAELREDSEYVRTKEECDKMAQGRLDSIAMNLVSGHGSCVGLPELIPGRYLKITDADKLLNGAYFLTKVKHKFSEDGYVTEFEVKGARA